MGFSVKKSHIVKNTVREPVVAQDLSVHQEMSSLTLCQELFDCLK